MIRLTNLSCVFQTGQVETTAIDSLNLTIETGEFVGIMGPSGSGKSTLLNVLGMMDSPNSGGYFFDGADIAKYSESKLSELRKTSIGFVFQSFNLVDDLTVYENVELPLLYLKVPKVQRVARVNAILKRFNLEPRAGHFPQHLSGGQQQRVAVARALVIEPKLLLADEPTGNLDSKNGKDVMEMLLELNKEGTTVIMVTHSETQIDYCDRVVRLLDGQLVSDVKPVQIEEEADVYA
ncbi:MAG: putative ABC transport system ATP-binding protein [Phenylobacterium sp.]|jgi:putative ABC transport system ATP-binding protein